MTTAGSRYTDRANNGNRPAGGSTARPDHWWDRPALPLVAGIGYVLAWVVGLVVAPSGTDVQSSGRQVVSALSGHRDAGALQFVLTEMVSAVALATVVWALARVARVAHVARRRLRAGDRAPDALLGAGWLAAAISLLQGAVGLYLTLSVVGAGRTGTAGALNDAINRADGVKMAVLAIMAVAAWPLARAGVLPRWFAGLSGLLAVALVASGVGYLLLLDGLASAAYISLPLLLLWVAAAGLLVSRRAGSR